MPGRVCLPARWFAVVLGVFVARALRPLVRSGGFDLSVVVAASAAPGPAAELGTLVRGTGRLVADARNRITAVKGRTSFRPFARTRFMWVVTPVPRALAVPKSRRKS